MENQLEGKKYMVKLNNEIKSRNSVRNSTDLINLNIRNSLKS